MVEEGSHVSNTQLPLVCTGGFQDSCEQEVGLCFVFLFLLLNYISLGFSGPRDGSFLFRFSVGLRTKGRV